MRSLKNAPLQEVVFEVRWELDVNPENNSYQDSGFDFALGTFARSLSSTYPDQQKKPHVLIQDSPMPYAITHVFRDGQDGWPIVQIGPGIMTVNDREGTYDWTNYYGQIKDALNKLSKAYTKPLRFNFSSLRYIDSIKTSDYQRTSGWDQFLEEKMNIQFKNLFNTRGKLIDFNFSQIFELEDDNRLLIAIASGKENNDERLIWQTAVFKQQHVDLKELVTWVKDAHGHTSPLFREMLKPNFYGSFS